MALMTGSDSLMLGVLAAVILTGALAVAVARWHQARLQPVRSRVRR